MANKPKIYDSRASLEFSLSSLCECYSDLSVERIVYKHLAANDNSKNQPYMAADFSEIGFIPSGDLVPSSTSSSKKMNQKRRTKFTSFLNFQWLSPDGKTYIAPDAKLIYYPQFPEVRLSGFLKGCSVDISEWMDPNKSGRSLGRVLFLGIRGDGAIFSYLAIPDSRISREIRDWDSIPITSLLHRLIPKARQLSIFTGVNDARANYSLQHSGGSTAKQGLIDELKRIHFKGPISSKRLNKIGVEIPYKARNGGGYTLEAELGIIPNGIAEPDFLGWEVKQFGVKRFDLIKSKPLTVMTPEPDGGVYALQGAKDFVLRYGYTNGGDRYDFTGRHLANSVCKKSGLTLIANGFDPVNREMTNAAGFLGLLDSQDNVAASWSFSKLLEHWKRKHSKAVYIPSLASDLESGNRAYHYGSNIRLFEGTNINMLLSAVLDKAVYYDPGIKVENVSAGGKVKARSQFRIKSAELDCLYLSKVEMDLSDF